MLAVALVVDVSLVALLTIGAVRHRRASTAAILLTTVIADALATHLVLAAGAPAGVTMAAKLVKRGALALAVAEIGLRIFHRALPGGRRVVLVGLSVTLATGAVATLAALAPAAMASDRVWYFALVEAERRLSVTVVVAAALLLSYSARRWPLDPWHRDLLAGLVVYHGAVMVFSPREALGGEWMALWPPYLHTCLVGWWCWAAWRGVDAPIGVDQATLARVWPWRATTAP